MYSLITSVIKIIKLTAIKENLLFSLCFILTISYFLLDPNSILLILLIFLFYLLYFYVINSLLDDLNLTLLNLKNNFINLINENLNLLNLLRKYYRQNYLVNTSWNNLFNFFNSKQFLFFKFYNLTILNNYSLFFVLIKIKLLTLKNLVKKKLVF